LRLKQINIEAQNQMKKSIPTSFEIWLKILVLIVVLNIVLFTGASLARMPPSPELSFLSGTWVFLDAAVAALLFGLLLKLHTFRTDTGKIWLSFFVGMSLSALGELAYTILETLGYEAYPSLADLFYLGSYIPLALGLVMAKNAIPIPLNRIWVYAYTGIFIVLSIGVLILLGPNLIIVEPLETITGLLYPLGDLLLFYLASFILLKLRSAEFAQTWILIMLGFLMYVVADLWYVWQDSVLQTYGTFGFEFVDGLYIIAYASFIFGAVTNFRLLLRIFGRTTNV